MVLLLSVVFVCCRIGISSNTCWSTVLKNCRTAAGAVIVCLWWRWHTQHRNLWRPDLVTSSFFFLPQAQCRPQWHRGWYLQWPVQQTPGHYKANQLFALANLWLLFLHFNQIWLQRSLHVYFCRLLHLIPTGGEHTLWNRFQRGLTNHCFCLSGIPPGHSPQATPLRLSVSCPLLPSGSHAHFCSPKFLEKWHICNIVLLFSVKEVCSGCLVSGIHSSGWGTHVVEKNAALVRWYVTNVQRLYLSFSHHYAGGNIDHNQTMLVCNRCQR